MLAFLDSNNSRWRTGSPRARYRAFPSETFA
jgi:hypothetical protein